LSAEYLNSIVREAMPLEHLKKQGIFFTGDDLAHEAASSISEDLGTKSKVLDPACGSGNLLIAMSKYLPVRKALGATLKLWSGILHGYELNPKFVQIAKRRLVLEAINRGAKIDVHGAEEASELLTNIKLHNALDKSSKHKKYTHIIMNPPYNPMPNNGDSLWTATSKVNAAALFTKFYLEKTPAGSKFVAILPEVLRSGFRYREWRNHVAGMIDGHIEPKGQFDSKTYIDVFVLSGTGTNGKENLIKWEDTPKSPYKSRIEDYFDVSVGPLVAYRDKLAGTKAPYIYPKNVEPWKKSNPQSEYRKYSGRLIKPPFVVIRRTSSPRDKHRAVASVITGKTAIAVENHFIVCRPKSGRVNDCVTLMRNCKENLTNDYLNTLIRCRHLTVSSVKSIPVNME